MPNWVENALTVYTKDAALLSEIRTAVAGSITWFDGKKSETVDSPISLNAVVPVANDDDRSMAWGVNREAWKATITEETETWVSYRFLSAWGSPERVIGEISTRFPNAVIFHSWVSPEFDEMAYHYLVAGIAAISEMEHEGPAPSEFQMFDEHGDVVDADPVYPVEYTFQEAIAEEFAPVPA